MEENPKLSPNSLSSQRLSALEHFRSTLGESDRQILDDLLERANQHQAAIQHSGHPLPNHVRLLAMLLEEHKEIARLTEQIETLLAKRGARADRAGGEA